MEENKNFDYSEDSWRHKEPQSHKEVCLRAIEECRVQLSKDLREGGTYPVETARGVLPVYFPDQREVIISTINTLYDLMLWYFDNKATESLEEIEEEIEKAPKKFFEEYLKVEHCLAYKEKAQKTKIMQIGKHSNMGTAISKKMETYILQRYRFIFQELVLLFKRKNELSGKRKAGYE